MPDAFLAQITSVVQQRRGKPLANGEIQFLCPAHDDSKPSAYWNAEKATWYCHGCGTKGGWKDLAGRLGIALPQRERAGGGKQKAEIIATYDYYSADRILLFQVCRTADKRFFQRQPDGAGGWINGLGSVKPVLYKLPEVLQAVQRGDTVFIPEGEKDADNLNRLGMTATTSPMGAGKWRESYAEFLHGANIIILPDVDEPGRKHAEQVARSLYGKAASAKVLEIPGLPVKGDVSDWIAGGGTKDKLLRLAAECPEWEPEERQPTDPEQRTILITNRFMREITADTLQALSAANNPPVLFRTGNEIVRLTPCDTAEPFTVSALRGRMDRVADYVKFNGDGEEVPARPPEDVAKDVLSLPAGEIPFPELRGVRHVPIFLESGALLASEGYDQASGWLLRLRGLNGVLDNMLVDKARQLLDELLYDFPFADESSKAHTIALILQPFVRELIGGLVPMFLIDAPARGTGKGLLAEVAVTTSTGRGAAVMSLNKDGDEVEKRITALLLAGHSHIQLDNVRVLRSPHLEAALTAEIWNGRRLGRSEMLYLPNRATWLATGNNVELSDEMARRIVPIRLDAGVERPEDRDGFKHELPKWVHKNRNRIVSACVSIVRAWLQAGGPQGTTTLGRYETWAKVMGGLVGFAGYEGFLSNRLTMQGRADSESREWTATVRIWWEQYNERPITANDLFEILKERGLLLDLWGGRAKTGALQRIGHALLRKRDRVYGEFTIRTAGHDSLNRSNAYRLETSSEGYHKTPKTPETPGTEPETPDFIDFLSNDTAGGFEPDETKTPTKPRQNPDQKTPDSIDFSGFSGVSGVLKSPPAEDENKDGWEAF